MSAPGATLGAVIHHDFELASDPRPLRTALEALFGIGRESDGALEMWDLPLKGKGNRPPVPYSSRRLANKIAKARVSTVGVNTLRRVEDVDAVHVSAQTRPLSDHPERVSLTRCFYDIHAIFGASQARDLGPRRVIDAIVAFADSVRVRAGVVFWAVESQAASRRRCALGPPGAETREGYFYGRWGQVIRGPAWGTFLGAHHVERMGGIERVREAPCARVVALASGGAYLEATPIEAPLVEDRHDGAVLAQLAEFLEPVMPPPLPPPERRGPGFVVP